MAYPRSSAAAVTAILLCLAAPASADSLGLRFGEVAVSSGAGLRVTGDFAITSAHGLQFDMQATAHDDGLLGQLDAHLYLMPTDQAKYGVFASLADVDGREATIAQVGVEAMFALSDRTEVHGRAGLGMAWPGNIDFISLSVGASHGFSDEVALFADLTVSEFDEEILRAVGYSARIGISYQPGGQPWEVSAALVSDGLHGRDARAAETRVDLGFVWHFGAGGGARRPIGANAFGADQPFDPLLRRGTF